MLAAIARGKGLPEVLEIKELPVPAFDEYEILVHIRAIGINPVDAFTRRNGYEGAFPKVLGIDFAGEIAETGIATSRFRVGDRVAGLTPGPRDTGAYAEYIVAKESQLALIPDAIPYEVAASLPVAALTAYQVLYYDMNLKKGQRILIHAGADGVGIFAIQLARLRGAYVIATASPENFEYCRQLGAQEVIDAAATASIAESKWDVVLLPVDGETQTPAARASGGDLERVLDLVLMGKLKTDIRAIIPFNEIVRAHQLIETNHTRGKIVVNRIFPD